MVSHSFSTIGRLRRSHTGAQLHLQNIFNLLKRLQASMSHATPKEMTLGEYILILISKSLLSNSVNVSNAAWLWIFQKLAGWVQLPTSQARTSTAMNRREQHTGFHEWVLSASNPRASRGAGIGKLHRHVNSPNVARSLCQVSTEEGVLRSTPSALMEVRALTVSRHSDWPVVLC